MAEENNVTTNEAQEEVFQIHVEEKERFNPTGSLIMITSDELGALINQLFSVYDDYEGCTYDVNPQMNAFSVNAIFNHKNVKGAEGNFAVTFEKPDSGNVRNETVRNLRSRRDKLNNGDTWYLTEIGKSGIKPFLLPPAAFNNNGYGVWDRKKGDVNWANVVCEWGTGDPFVAQQQVYTKVRYLDPIALLKEIYGVKDEEGNKWFYQTQIVRSLATDQYGNIRKFMMQISRLNIDGVTDLARKSGIPVFGGMDDIIR